MQIITFNELPEAVSQLNKKLDNLERLLSEIVNKPQRQTDKLLTVSECARFLNLSKPTIYTLVSNNSIPYMKQSKRLYFSQLELLEYLKKGRNKTNAEIERDANEYLNKRKGAQNG